MQVQEAPSTIVRSKYVFNSFNNCKLLSNQKKLGRYYLMKSFTIQKKFKSKIKFPSKQLI